MSTYHIGALSQLLGLSIELLPRIARNQSGLRIYEDKDVSRLKFIKRAQRMSFTLAEINQLLKMRENPQNARASARALAHEKLAEIKEQLAELRTLQNELQLLVNLCQGAPEGCPIIEGIDK